MTDRSYVLSLTDCRDPVLVGGKAEGLSRLLHGGLPVPSGLCLTGAAYVRVLETAGIDVNAEWTAIGRAAEAQRPALLERLRGRIRALTLPPDVRGELHRRLRALETSEQGLWAVRSSASEEDATDASYGGLFHTKLGVRLADMDCAVAECWASLWSWPAWCYRTRRPRPGHSVSVPVMAVVLQPLLPALASGVAYSCHPVTREATQVVVDAVLGLAQPLVQGEVTPDHFVVDAPPSRPARILTRDIAAKSKVLEVVAGGVEERALSRPQAERPALDDPTLQQLAVLVKRVETAEGRPVDVEWAVDARGLWLLQARPIVFGTDRICKPDAQWTWSRANFRETLPEVPSPMAIALLEGYMEACILRHYREVGCEIPPGLSSVRVIQGRPYINVSLMQMLVGQVGGDPGEVTSLMGGEPGMPPPATSRLSLPRLIPLGIRLEGKLRAAQRKAPRWFHELRQMGRAQKQEDLERLTESKLLETLLAFNERLSDGDITFAIVAAVSRAFTVLRWTLQRRLPDTWRPLLNAVTQGLGTIISAQQILWLRRLAEQAAAEESVKTFFSAETWEPKNVRVCLGGTAWLAEFDRFLDEYGHRAIGESDMRSPRFAEDPAYVLGIVRNHLASMKGGPLRSDPAVQGRLREEGLRTIRRAFGWRLHEWWWFQRWHRELARMQALREANRHALMHYVAGGKSLLLLLSRRLVDRGILEQADDVFFLVPDELQSLVADLSGGPRRDWKAIVAARRAQMDRNLETMPPDVVYGEVRHSFESGPDGPAWDLDGLRGMPISAGRAEGRVRVIRSADDICKVKEGEIVVAPVLDPGMAPAMGLAAGFVVEMGGMLSHGAIIAREFGLPVLVNVRRATSLLKDDERVVIDTQEGSVRRIVQT